MKVNQSFINDFKYLEGFYGWTSEESEEMKAAIRSTEEAGKRYITALAGAHRKGYKQDARNGFQRLHDWCAANGIDDPFNPKFDMPVLNTVSIQSMV